MIIIPTADVDNSSRTILHRQLIAGDLDDCCLVGLNLRKNNEVGCLCFLRIGKFMIIG